MIGIFVGVWALIVVLSVMNGFQKEVRTRILGVASHVQITSIDNRLPDWRSVAALAAQHPRVRATAPFVQAQRSEEHTSELQSLAYLVCRLLLEKKKKKK